MNALLSLAHASLVREATQVLVTVGLDAWVGMFHLPDPGRPALALDLAEELGPVLADAVVLELLNGGGVSRADFDLRPLGARLREPGRRALADAFERKLAEEVVHPVFGNRLSYRRIVEVQARLLAKTVLGEVDAYPPFLSA